jgi:hypothetical protein
MEERSMTTATYDDILRRQREARARHAHEMAARWLHLGNLAHERGAEALAERHYARAQKWHDKMNRQLGNGDGSEEA